MPLPRHPWLAFLIGARASGKSTLGRLLAERLALAFIDTDLHIRAVSGLEVDEIVARGGWPAFRARESALLRECACPRTVVATGGGMVLDWGVHLIDQICDAYKEKITQVISAAVAGQKEHHHIVSACAG